MLCPRTAKHARSMLTDHTNSYLGSAVFSGLIANLLKLLMNPVSAPAIRSPAPLSHWLTDERCRSLAQNGLRRSRAFVRPSLGASGAVCAIFATSALLFPHNQYQIMFIPYPIEAENLLPGLVGFDTIGLIYSHFKTSQLGHGAHLGGYLCGYGAFNYLERNNPTAQRILRAQGRNRPGISSRYR